MQKKKRSVLFSILCAAFLLLTACSAGGKGAVITCDDYEIKLSKTTVGDLKEAGFTNRYSSIEESTLDSRTYDTFYPMKDDVSYGMMYVGNKRASQIEFDKGVIFEISFSYDDPESPLGEVLVNGVNFEGYTREQVKEAMGDAEITLDYDEYLCFETGGCEYTFTFEDGSETVTDLRIDDGTETEFVIQ